MIHREQYMRQIRPFMNSDVIKVLTGFRRSGKSVMLELIQEELHTQGVHDTQVMSFNFESFANVKLLTAAALYEELTHRIAQTEGKVYLFFDEIQEVSDWERCVSSCRVDFDCDIYITGSNAKLLSGELATRLGGRYVEFVIYPFSFAEYIVSRTAHGDTIDTAAAFRTYIECGGMPFLTNFIDVREPARQYLRDIYSSVVLKDIIKRNNIRDVDLLERIITYIMANVGHTFSARSITNYLKNEQRKAAPETILNYVRAACDAYLFYKLSREDIVGKKILSVNEKYYIVDHGLREAIFGGNTRDIDQLLENIVCMELLRRGWHVTVGKSDIREIDFIATKEGSRIYIQVTYLLATEETIDREFEPLENIRDNYPKYVLSLDEFDRSRHGIRHHNIRDFLLTEEWD
jgi:hypothetical protein